MKLVRRIAEMPSSSLPSVLIGLSLFIVVNLPSRRSQSIEGGSHSPSDGPSHTHINAFSLVIGRFGNQSESVLRPPEVNRLLVDVFRKFRCGDASDSAATAVVTDCQRVLDECLNTSALFRILGLSDVKRLDESAFQKAALVVLKVLLFYPKNCQKITGDLDYERSFQLELMKYAKPTNAHYFTRDQLSRLLFELKHRFLGDRGSTSKDHDHDHDHTDHDHSGHNHTGHDHEHEHGHSTSESAVGKRGIGHECVDERLLFDEELHAGDHGVGRADLERMAGLIVAFIAQGLPIGCRAADLPDAGFFIDDLFEDLGKPTGTISEKEFGDLVSKLGIGKKRSNGHDHDHDHDHDHSSPHSHSAPHAHSRSSNRVHVAGASPHDDSLQDIRPKSQDMRRVLDPSDNNNNINNGHLYDYIDYGDHIHAYIHDHTHDHTHDHDHLHSHDADQGYGRKKREANHGHEHKCYSSEQLLDIFGVFHSVGINKRQFVNICPALVQQVFSHACADEEQRPAMKRELRVTQSEAYGYGFLSVAIISAASVCGILLVPCLGKGIYESVISGLICLAIGTMLGDAVLHLIPQCLGLHTHEDASGHDHANESLADRLEEMGYLWKMFTVILAIYAFYLLESFFAYLGRRFGDETDSGHDHGEEGHSHLPDFDATKKLHLKNVLRKDSQRSQVSDKDENNARRPPSEYGSMTSMASMDTTGKEFELGISNPALNLSDEGGSGAGGAGRSEVQPADTSVVLVSHRDFGEGATNTAGSIELQQNVNGEIVEEVKEESHSHAKEEAHSHVKEEAHSHAYRNADPELLQQFARKPKGICGIPTVAMLILIGDAIHNFADGIAIGAAFAGDVTSGLSTSIAIFMHEVPHEFGDFAVFISTGLSYKRALCLNLLSACTAFLGLFLGVSIASDIRVRLWILSITAGMFLYVSLVDMLPEVMHNGISKTLRGFCIQNLGIWCGIGLMFLIAIFEDSIKI